MLLIQDQTVRYSLESSHYKVFKYHSNRVAIILCINEYNCIDETNVIVRMYILYVIAQRNLYVI